MTINQNSLSSSLEHFSNLKKGRKVELFFWFQGIKMSLIGKIGDTEKKSNASFVEIKDPQKKYLTTLLKKPFQYILGIYRDKKRPFSLMIDDGGAIRPVPFQINIL